MKTLLFNILFLSSLITSAQGESNWTEWTLIYPQVYVSYKVSYCGPIGLVGYSFYRTKNDSQRDRCFVSFAFEFKKCEGGTGIESTIKVDLSKTGINEDQGMWFLGNQVTKKYFDVEYLDYSPKQTGKATSSGLGKNLNSDSIEQANQQNQRQQQIQNQQIENDRRQQQLQNQLNQITQEYNDNSARIQAVFGSISGMIGQIQANMIQKNIQDLNNTRQRKYEQMKSNLQQFGGTLNACGGCSGSGIISCPTCNQNPINKCSYCNGSGSMQSFGTTMACNLCGGTGKTICSNCGGVGSKLCNSCFGAGYSISDSQIIPNGNPQLVTSPAPKLEYLADDYGKKMSLKKNSNFKESREWGYVDPGEVSPIKCCECKEVFSFTGPALKSETDGYTTSPVFASNDGKSGIAFLVHFEGPNRMIRGTLPYVEFIFRMYGVDKCTLKFPISLVFKDGTAVRLGDKNYQGCDAELKWANAFSVGHVVTKEILSPLKSQELKSIIISTTSGDFDQNLSEKDSQYIFSAFNCIWDNKWKVRPFSK